MYLFFYIMIQITLKLIGVKGVLYFSPGGVGGEEVHMGSICLCVGMQRLYKLKLFYILLYVYDTMNRFLFSELILLSHLHYV